MNRPGNRKAEPEKSVGKTSPVIFCLCASHIFHRFLCNFSQKCGILDGAICAMLYFKEERVLIEVKNLVKKYGDHIAVDHLSFTVEKGQILGFLGPNGAGKSTTMNMLTGYISSTEGSIVINGHDIYDEPEETKKSIGYLPEQPPVYPDMTVLEYLRFVMDIKKVPGNRRAAMLADIMARTGIADVSGRLIKHLSKGYRQRVGLAQAIVGYPEVIILDEPTVGLDPMQIIEIRELMKGLAKRHTVIISSHILSEISAVCDTVMIINKGKMVVTDKVENLPKHLKGASKLELEVKGSMQAVRAALRMLPESADVRFRKGGRDNFVHVTVGAAEEEELREKIFYALADAKCPIYMMNMNRLSLEDIFLEMTRQADANGVPEAAEREDIPENPENGAGTGPDVPEETARPGQNDPGRTVRSEKNGPEEAVPPEPNGAAAPPGQMRPADGGKSEKGGEE